MISTFKKRNIAWVALGALASSGLPETAMAQSGQEAVDTIVVTGSRASLTSALSKQRNSDRVLSVADSDALGNFPDTTAAEAMRRLAGIAVENDQ
jgi:outer membrane cobalamin receptor